MDNADEQLIGFFKKSGANEKQSQTMANQLVKRAGQLSRQKGWTELEALEYLLKRIAEAQKG